MLAGLLITEPALACPNCAVGIEARSDVWSQDFWFNLLVSVAPFFVIGAVCICIEERENARLAIALDREDMAGRVPGDKPSLDRS